MNVGESAGVIGVSFIAFCGLRLYFHIFKIIWPDRYFGGERAIEAEVSRTPLRFASFRLLPVLVALVFAGTSAHRLGVDRNCVIVLTAAAHALWGPVRGMAEALLSKPIMLGSAIHRLMVSMGILGVTEIAVLLGRLPDQYIPTLREVVLAAWVGLFVFMLTQLGFSFTVPQPDIGVLISRAEEEIEPHLLEGLDSADPSRLFSAIAIGEHLQRPPWVRYVERKVVFRNGSYGLMQMRAKRPLSDDDSVGEFVKKFQRKLPGPIRQAVEDDVHPFWEDEQLRKFVSRHNKDEEFIDLVVLIHSHRAF